jgi:hypothetical protein
MKTICSPTAMFIQAVRAFGVFIFSQVAFFMLA